MSGGKRPGVVAMAATAWKAATLIGASSLALQGTAAAQNSDELSGVVVETAPITLQDPTFTAPLLDTPRNITVITEETLNQVGATSLMDALRMSPGITFGAGEGGQPLADRPFIRGQSSGNNMFVDGVRDTGGQSREIFNLEQVEVIRGADSVYSGRGSGGGSINTVTKTPKPSDFQRASIGVGTSDYYRVTGDINWAFTDTAAVRLNMLATEGATPEREDVEFEHYGWAPSIAFGIGTDTRFTASYYHYETDDMPDYGVPTVRKRGTGSWADPNDIPEDGILDVDRSSFYGLFARDYHRTEADIATLVFEHDFSDDLTFRGVLRHGVTLNDYVVTNPGDGGAAQQDSSGEWWMQRRTKSRWNEATTTAFVADVFGEFQTGLIGHSFDIGAEINQEQNLNASYAVTTTSGAPCPASTTYTGDDCTLLYSPDPTDPWTGTIIRNPVTDVDSDSYGIYAFDTIELTPQWLINLGVRYDDYETRSVGRPRGAWSFINYQAGLVYKPTDNSSIYASYSTSSTPPNLSGGDQNSAASTTTSILDPEESINIEFGAKIFLWDRLNITAALFRTERNNARIEVSPGIFEQAGETLVEGFELGISGEILEGWSVFGGYTYMDSELVQGAYTNANVGDPLANTPEHSFSLFSTYDLTNRLTIGGGAYYVSDSFGGNQGGAGGGTWGVYAPEYWRYDAYAGFRITDNVDLQLNIQNLSNEDYIVRTNGVHHADYGPGRQAILTLNLRY